MALNSDRDGFLLADERLSGGELTHSLRRIERDTASILALMKARQRSLNRSRVTNPNARRPAPAGAPRPAPAARPAADRASTPAAAQASSGEARRAAPGSTERARDSRGRFVRDPSADVAGEVRQFTRQQAQQNAERERAEESRRNREGNDSSGQPRDARGRFGSGGRAGNDDGSDGGSSESEKQGMFHRMKEFFKDRSGSVSLEGAEKVDPVIESAKEVMGMVGNAVGALRTTGELGRAVIGRGFGGRKRDDGQASWFRRLLQQLKLMRRDDTQFHRAELRALGEQRGGGGGGGGMSMIADVLKLIFSPLGAAIVAALAGIWMGFGEKIIDAWKGFVDGVKSKWDAAVDKFMDIWEPIAKFFSDKFGLAKQTAVDLGNKANDAIKDKTGIDVKAGVQRAAEAVSGVKDKAAAGLADMGNKISRLVSVKGTERVYERPDGTIEHRDGGTVAWRNNNPGNLKFGFKGSADTLDPDPAKRPKRSKEQALAAARRQYGPEVIDLDQFGNAIFSTPEAGRAAQAKLLLGRFKGDTVEEMLPKYAVNDYSGKADHAAYANSIHQFAKGRGLDLRGKKISDMSDAEVSTLLDAMKKTEGNKVGTTRLEPAPGAAPGTMPPAVAGSGAVPQAGALNPGGRPAANAAAPQGWANVLAPLATQDAAAHPGASPAAAGGGAQRPLVLGASKVPSVTMLAPQAGITPVTAAPPPTPTMAGAMSPPGMVAAPPRIPTVQIPAQMPPAPAPRADTPIRLGSKAPVEVTVRNNEQPAGQDLKDRRLAHIATGGMAG